MRQLRVYCSCSKNGSLHPANANAVAIRYDYIRTALLDTFPYMIHFSVDDDKKIITVLAVLHTARDPKVWKERVQ
jgi:hypothetical protein